MLHVSIHAGPLSGISHFNQVAWLNIGYNRLAPVADYKILGFAKGDGAGEPVTLSAYPRWSASLWDLTARAIALLLLPRNFPAVLTVPAFEPGEKRAAFATAMSALIQHRPSGTNARQPILATVDIVQEGRNRGLYRASFVEDLSGVHRTEPFLFRPKFLDPTELLLHAALVHLTGQHEQMPPAPRLSVPEELDVGGERYLPIHRLVEPARTGFKRWMSHRSVAPVAHPEAPQGLAPAALYMRFLHEAI